MVTGGVRMKLFSTIKTSVILLTTLGFLCAESAEQKSLRLGDQLLQVELAMTPAQRQQGLMYRKHLADNEGMLFIYPNSQRRSFWMKNTFIPLSVGLFDDERRLVEIMHMDPPRSQAQTKLPITSSQQSARYALEVRQGWFEDHEVSIGEDFELQ